MMVVTITTFGCPGGAAVKAGASGAIGVGGDDPKILESMKKKARKLSATMARDRRRTRRKEFRKVDQFALEVYGGGCELLRLLG